MHMTETELQKKMHHSGNCIHTWHRRFRHRNTAAIEKLSNEGLASGIKIKDCNKKNCKMRMLCKKKDGTNGFSERK